MTNNIQTILSFLEQKEGDLAIISDPLTIFYLTGFDSNPHERLFFLFIFRDQEPLLFLPQLEYERAKQEISLTLLAYSDSQNPWYLIKDFLSKTDYQKLYAEFNHLNVTCYQKLRHIFQTEFLDLTPLINQMTLIKSAEEIHLLKEAGHYADKAMQLGFSAIRPQATEIAIATEIDLGIRKEGIKKMSFETMVLSAEKAADPHGQPGLSLIQKDALLLFDLGVEYKGYCSDITRTVAVGRPDAFKKEIYDICLQAQLTALTSIRPGISAAEIDATARKVIEKAGYSEYFNHRLGHGIGHSVHQLPSITAGNDLIIEEGMCFSVEPGIYIPGKIGVRIEDCGVVTNKGFDLFTKTSKELLYF